MKFRFLIVLAAALCCCSCIESTMSIGENFIPGDSVYELKTIEFPLEDIQLKIADSLSGYSTAKVTFGSLRDEAGRLTARTSAIPLVPFYDTLDFGKNPQLRRFYISLVRDTVSVADKGQERILQNINVYELSEKIATNDVNTEPKHGTKRISRGIPVYNGGDSLSFEFTREFGEKYLGITQTELSDMSKYLERFPGIFLSTDDPVARGGRINLFQVQLDVDTDTYSVQGNFAELQFSAEYDGARKDTSFLFYFGPDKFYKIDSLLTNGTVGNLPQYAFNATRQETKGGKAEDYIFIDGGGGQKPVVSAAEIKKKLWDEIAQYGDPAQAVINKATLIFPFEFPEDYEQLDKYPAYLNPTCRVSVPGYVSYAGLTDTSSSTENGGDINRSLGAYMPDISYHVQSLLRAGENAKLSNYDVWLLILRDEIRIVKQAATTTSSDIDYLNYMMYYSNLYGGGYGGYGGYGYGGYGYGGYGYGGYGGYGYNSYYNNYMSYALASAYASSTTSSSSKQTETTLDTHRYYNAYLNGPTNSGAHPTLKVVYSVPKN